MAFRRLDRIDWTVITVGAIAISLFGVAGLRESKNSSPAAISECTVAATGHLGMPTSAIVSDSLTMAWRGRSRRGDPVSWEVHLVVDEPGRSGPANREYYHCELGYEPWPADRWTLRDVRVVPP